MIIQIHKLKDALQERWPLSPLQANKSLRDFYFKGACVRVHVTGVEESFSHPKHESCLGHSSQQRWTLTTSQSLRMRAAQMDRLGLVTFNSQKPAESKTEQATEPGGQRRPGECSVGGSERGDARTVSLN